MGIYLLFYVDKPDSADGKAILATASTFVQHGRFDMNVIGAGDWLLPPPARLGTFGIDGALYTKKGLTPSLALLPLVAAGQVFPWLSIRATAMLFNSIVTAATAVALYTLLRWSGYRPRTGLVVGLLFGLATLALPYVKTLFAEPLVGLILIGAIMVAYRFRQLSKSPSLILCGALLALAVGVNVLYALFIPVIAAYLFLPPKWTRRTLINLIVFAVPLLVGAVILTLYSWARFGSPLNSGYHFGDGEGFNQPFLTGLYGLFLSPYRGFFWYSPILLLAIPGWLMFRRGMPRLAWAALGLIAVQACGFASWWSWHGGIVWGPRFLVPALPLAALFLAPLVEAAWTRRHLWLILGGFAALSFGVQLLGGLYSYFPYTGYLFAHYEVDSVFSLAGKLADEVVFNPGLSPILGNLALARVGWPMEPVWLAHGIDVVHLLASLLLIGAGLIVLFRRGIAPRRLWFAVTIAMLISLNVIVARRQNTPERQQVRALEDALQPSATVLAATTLFDDALIDVRNGSRVITMNAPTTPDDPRAAQVWHYALMQDRRLWFVTWFGVADSHNWQELELFQTANFVLERSAGRHRALLFDLGASAEPDRKIEWHFGSSMRLAAYGVRRVDDGLYVTVQWQADQTPAENDSWFIHLIDENGTILAQQDRQPLGGYAPTSSWMPGALITDRLFLPLTRGASVSALRIGFVDPTGVRLPVFDAAGKTLADGFVLLAIP